MTLLCNMLSEGQYQFLLFSLALVNVYLVVALVTRIPAEKKDDP